MNTFGTNSCFKKCNSSDKRCVINAPKINLFQTNIKSIEITFEPIFELSGLVKVTHKVHTFIFAHTLLAYTPTTHPPSPSTSVQILFSKVDMTKIYFTNYNQRITNVTKAI